jgi:hypothetical protein
MLQSKPSLWSGIEGVVPKVIVGSWKASAKSSRVAGSACAIVCTLEKSALTFVQDLYVGSSRLVVLKLNFNC